MKLPAQRLLSGTSCKGRVKTHEQCPPGNDEFPGGLLYCQDWARDSGAAADCPRRALKMTENRCAVFRVFK